MITTRMSWANYPANVPSVFQRVEQAGVDYDYLGDGVFRESKTGECYRWTPHMDNPAKAEGWVAVPPAKALAGAVFYPSFSYWAEKEAPQQIPELKVASSSIRNFELVDKGTSLIGVLHIPTATIYLAPLVKRGDDTDVPSLYDKNFGSVENGSPRDAPVKYQSHQATAGGRFLKPIEDTRARVPQIPARKSASQAASVSAYAHVTATQSLLHMIMRLQTAAYRPSVRSAQQQTPLVVSGTAHQQLQSTIGGTVLEAMGFGIEKTSLQAVSFTSTSGTLNSAHFHALHLGKNWQRKIMEAVSHYLRVQVTLQKPLPGVEPVLHQPHWM